MTEGTDKLFFDDPAALDFSKLDLDRIQRESARMQGEAVFRHLAFVSGAVWRAVKWTAGVAAAVLTAVARAISAQRTYEVLNGLSDRQLDDIGLTRDGILDRIQMILDGVEPGAPETAVELVAVEGGRQDKRKDKRAKQRNRIPRRRAA